MDNLCRNPDLVVLVPASQEAEPLDIQVSLHPQAQVQTASSPLVRDSADWSGRSASTHRSPAGQVSPPSPSSLGVRSPPSTPFTAHKPGPASAAVSGATGAPGPDESATSGWRLRKSPGRGAAAAPAAVTGRSGDAATEPKKRGRLSLSARRPKLTRAGSGIGGRGTRTAPAPDPHLVSSWDGGGEATGGGDARELAAQAPATNGGTSPTPPGGLTPAADKRESLRSSSSRPAGGGIFASLARHRSGDAPKASGGRPSASATPAVVTPPSARREVSEGSGGGAGWRGACSASAQATSTAFFVEDTDDGGQESGSSYEEDDGDGPPSRRSYIRVACTARTSYKLFSSDPQVQVERDRVSRV